MNYSEIEAKSKHLIVNGPTDEVKAFALDVLDMVNEINRVADSLETEATEFDLSFAAKELQRTIDRQRKAIAQLRKRSKLADAIKQKKDYYLNHADQDEFAFGVLYACDIFLNLADETTVAGDAWSSAKSTTGE